MAGPVPPPTAPGEAEETNQTGIPAEDGDERPKPQLLEFQGDEIGLVLRTLARQARLNVVVSERVNGTVTLRLEDKTPKEAIEVIVAAKGLLMDERDGFLSIKTRDERTREPVERQLAWMAESTLPAVAQFKGQYFRQLVESGLPAEAATQVVLNEDLSNTVLAPLPAKESMSPSSKSDESGPDWLEKIVGNAVMAGTGLAVVSILPGVALHIALAIAVFIRGRRARARGERLVFFGPILWSLATLIGGVFLAAFYWISNESSLRSNVPSASPVRQ